MVTVNVHEAKTQLSRLLKQVEAGAEVVIARRGNPVARLVPLKKTGRPKFGAMKGNGAWEELSDIISEPLPDEELILWEGGP